MAQHYISIGPMYRVTCFFSGAGMESVIRITMQQSESTVQSPNVVSMSGQRRRLSVNIETALGEGKVYANYTADQVMD